jgi:hypothetical protein
VKNNTYRTVVQLLRNFGVPADISANILLAFAREDEGLLADALIGGDMNLAAILNSLFADVVESE